MNKRILVLFFLLILISFTISISASAKPQAIASTAYCTDDTWTLLPFENDPGERENHSAVWTGTEMIIWGGHNAQIVTLGTGARYNPTTNAWTPVSDVNAPEKRVLHTAVWTGMEMIVWGGLGTGSGTDQFLNTGSRYNPVTDTWTPISQTNAPAGRYLHTAIWTGSEMIVWGGFGNSSSGMLNDGGRYNPATDTWTPIPPDILGPGVPDAVWTGSEMILWKAESASPPLLFDGARYNPTNSTWTPITQDNAPDFGGTAVWTGEEMLLWPGSDVPGARYHPDVWGRMSDVNQPSLRSQPVGVWTGHEMIIWSGNGVDREDYLADGGRYNPVTNSWKPTSEVNVPLNRANASGVWTGHEMIIYGGHDQEGTMEGGGRYCAAPPEPPVEIVVKKVNPNSTGKIKVKLLGTDAFNAADVDVTTVRFGPTGIEATVVSSKLKDVNRDSHVDLLLKFSIVDTQITCGDTLVTLTGRLKNGQSFSATATIKTSHCS